MAKKPAEPRSIIVECPKVPAPTGSKKSTPRIVIDISEGSATLVRCPFKDIDIEIHDYDVPEDWNPDNAVTIEPTVETSMGVDVFGRRYQKIKFKRRQKLK